MAKKVSTVYVCQECGYESPKWMGQCICGAWNAMTEEKIIPAVEEDKRRRTSFGMAHRMDGAGDTVGSKGAERGPQPLKDVKSGNWSRMDTGNNELNRVLGGGLIKGSLTLISGEPGIGKSTLILQAAAKIAQNHGIVLYVTGEESEEQVKIRADRVCGNGLDKLYIVSETSMEKIFQYVEKLSPVFLIIDSIQTMFSADLDSAPGTVSQVRLCGNELMRMGKGRQLPIFIVAHVTKSGELAGPKIIEHLVDCVLHFTGERSRELRILRSLKNRFGTTNEIGAFEMQEQGICEVENLSKSFIADMDGEREGSVATAVYEGTRPLLLEIQALTSPTNIGFARRTAIGVDNSRLNMLIAVLERKAGISLINQDVYVNVVGGLKPEGTSHDLAVALAIYSSLRGMAVNPKVLALGEVGLTGDLRSVQHTDKIASEADRMGFEAMILPKRNSEKIRNKGQNLKLYGVANLKEAIDILINKINERID